MPECEANGVPHHTTAASQLQQTAASAHCIALLRLLLSVLLLSVLLLSVLLLSVLLLSVLLLSVLLLSLLLLSVLLLLVLLLSLLLLLQAQSPAQYLYDHSEASSWANY